MTDFKRIPELVELLRQPYTAYKRIGELRKLHSEVAAILSWTTTARFKWGPNGMVADPKGGYVWLEDAGRSCSILGACAFPNCDCPATPESETPETPSSFLDRVERTVKYHQSLGFGHGEDAYSELFRVARQLHGDLSLALTEIKGHMRVEDELKARIAELEKALHGVIAEADRDTDAFIFARALLKSRA